MARPPRRARKGENPFAAGLDRLERGVAEAVGGKEASPAVRLAGFELVRAIKVELNTPGKGREYRRKGGKIHRASAPGQPPARDIGELINSIGMVMVGGVLRVGTDQPKAPTLELGGAVPNRLKTDGNSVGITLIAPRPFMRPALKKARKAMGEVAVGELRSVTRKL